MYQALDDVCPSTETNPARVIEAMHRTLRWIDRCISAHSRPHEQNLFGIVQGQLCLCVMYHVYMCCVMSDIMYPISCVIMCI